MAYLRLLANYVTKSTLPPPSKMGEHKWKRTNPGGGGSFGPIKAGPTGQIITGSDLGGAYYSWDNGQSWSVYGAERGLYNTHVSAVAFHPTNELIFYLGTDSGIYRSETGGGYFEQVLSSGYIGTIEVAKSNPDIAYAAYHPTFDSKNGVIYKTINGGDTWVQASSDLPNNLRLIKIAIDPTDANTLYVLSGSVRFACTPSEVYRSQNGGQNWTHISQNTDPVLDIAVHPTNRKVFMTTMNADCSQDPNWDGLAGSFYESSNYGTSWINKSTQTGFIWINQDNPSMIRIIDPREPFPWNPAAGTWESTNSGTSWTKIGDVENWTTGYQSAYHWAYGTSFDSGIAKTIGSSYASSNSAFWANTQWIYGTLDGGQTFNALHTKEVADNWWQSTGVDNIVMFDLEISEADPNILYAGFWDLGTWRSLDHGKSWQSCNHPDYTGNWNGFGGNTPSLVADPSRDNVMWAAIQGDKSENAFLLRSNYYAEKDSWIPSSTGLPSSPNISGLSIDKNSPTDLRILFVTVDGDIYRSTNDGWHWAKVLDNGAMRFTAVDRFNSNLIYAGGEGGFWRSADGGDSWEETGLVEMRGTISGPISTYGWEGIFDMCVDPSNSGWIYVAAMGDEKGLYFSNDGGLHWDKLLTDNYMRSVGVSPNNPNQIYAGMSAPHYAGGYHPDSKGILYSADGGATWTDVNNESPFPFALTIDISKESPAHVFVGMPGSGFQSSIVGGENPSSCLTEIINLTYDSISKGIYQTSKGITVTGIIPNNTSVEFLAGETVLLTSGFHAQSGSTFKVTIGDCTTNNLIQQEEKTVDKFVPYPELSSKLSTKSNTTNLLLYPSPVNQNVTINYTLAARESTQLLLFNSNGTMINQIKSDQLLDEGTYHLQFDTSNLAKGVYWISLKAGQNITTQKMIKL